MSPEIVASIITSCALLLSAVAALFAYDRHARRDVIKADEIESNRSRRNLYEEFISAMFGLFDATKGGGAVSSKIERETGEIIKRFRTRIALVGSDEVIRAFNDWDVYNNMAARPADVVMVRIADLMRAMRKDLGYPETRIRRIDLLAVFITDVEKLEEVCKKDLGHRFQDSQSL